MQRTPLPDRMFYRIGEVAEHLGVKSSVLRYWETEFRILAPHKSASGQRVYRNQDVQLLCLLQQLLYVERYSIEGARLRLKELKREGKLKESAQNAYQNPVVLEGAQLPLELINPPLELPPLVLSGLRERVTLLKEWIEGERRTLFNSHSSSAELPLESLPTDLMPSVSQAAPKALDL